MTEQELKIAWESYSEGSNVKTKNKLVEYYYGLVDKIASSYSKKMNNKVSKEELMSHGVSGLYAAIDGFDLSRKIKFETYASLRIKGSMIDGLRSEDWVPRSVRIRNSKIEKTRSKASVMGDASEISILEEAGICKSDFYKNVKKYIPTSISSLDNPISMKNGDEHTVDTNENIKSYEDVGYENISRLESFKKLLNDNYSILEKKIIYYYYYKSLTMGEIANKLNVSESRVSQVHKKTLKRLKTQIMSNKEIYKNEFKEILKI